MLAFQIPGLGEWICLLAPGGIILAVILVAVRRSIPPPPGFPVVPTGGRRCDKCRAMIDAQAAFCPRCGQRLG